MTHFYILFFCLICQKILSRELERTSEIFQSTAERQSTLIGSCAIASAFLIYLGPYKYAFRRLMLTVHWIKAIQDRGLTIVFDQISSVKGRIINWQLNPLSDSHIEVFFIYSNAENWINSRFRQTKKQNY